MFYLRRLTHQNGNAHLISVVHKGICNMACLVPVCNSLTHRCDNTCPSTPPCNGTDSRLVSQSGEQDIPMNHCWCPVHYNDTHLRDKWFEHILIALITIGIRYKFHNVDPPPQSD